MTKKNDANRQPVVGFTASAFDLCHAGHMLMLKDAKNVCDYLIVALHDDPSDVSDLGYRLETGNKPKNRPIMSLEERKEILEGTKYVDEVIIYRTEAELYDLLQTLKFDVRILGSDWEGKPYTGHDLPHKAYFHNRSHNYSTSELRERVYEAERLKRDYQRAVSRMEEEVLDKATMEAEKEENG
jgi:glycerol-3-phosphate cytidylyltransferase